MNNKTATLGIGAAVIGVLTALVGAALAGKSVPRLQPKSDGAGGDRAPTPASGQGTNEPAGLAQPTTASGPVNASDAASGATAAAPAPTGEEGHAAPDLASDAVLGPDHRAPVAFRPDMDAPMTPAEREALRPATGPSPSLVSDRGTGFQPGGER